MGGTVEEISKTKYVNHAKYYKIMKHFWTIKNNLNI